MLEKREIIKCLERYYIQLNISPHHQPKQKSQYSVANECQETNHKFFQFTSPDATHPPPLHQSRNEISRLTSVVSIRQMGRCDSVCARGATDAITLCTYFQEISGGHVGNCLAILGVAEDDS